MRDPLIILAEISEKQFELSQLYRAVNSDSSAALAAILLHLAQEEKGVPDVIRELHEVRSFEVSRELIAEKEKHLCELFEELNSALPVPA